MITVREANIAVAVILAFSTIWLAYNAFVRSDTFNPMSIAIYTPPRWISCAIPYVHRSGAIPCSDININGWSIGHFALYFCMGALVPGYWRYVLAVSLACEAYEYIVGWRARWILDPVVNLAGYFSGQCVHIVVDNDTIYLAANVAVTCIVLLINRPGMFPHIKIF